MRPTPERQRAAADRRRSRMAGWFGLCLFGLGIAIVGWPIVVGVALMIIGWTAWADR